MKCDITSTVNIRVNALDGVNASPQIFLFVMFNLFSNDQETQEFHKYAYRRLPECLRYMLNICLI